MIIRSRRLERAVGLLATWACLELALAGLLGAQVPVANGPVLQPVAGKWQIEPQTSLTWWQINPDFSHLWATTCPADPFWMPGDGAAGGAMLPTSHSSQHYYRGDGKNLPSGLPIPFFRRLEVTPVCGQAVQGEVVMRDASGWKGVAGNVVIDANRIVTGSENRDRYMYSIIETAKYPTISFRLDSLQNVQPGDTLHATAVGVFTLLGLDRPVSVPVKAWREGDRIRAMGQFMFSTDELVTTYHMSTYKLGLGVVGALWKELYMGFDLLLAPPH